MPTVKIPPVLRAHVGGEATIEAAGATVGEVLDGLVSEHEGLGNQLFDAEGQLNRFVNIYLNDEDVRLLDGLGTSASDSDTIVILPAMAGGSR